MKKYTLGGINSRLNDIKDWIDELEDSGRNHYQWTEKKKKEWKEDSLRDLWDNTKHTKNPIIQVPEEEEREKQAENISENLIAENLPNLGNKTVT